MSLVPTRDEVPQIARYAGISARRAAAPASRTTTGFSFTGKDFLRMLRRRKWLIIISFMVFLAASIVSTALWRKFAPFYTAEALLVVNPPRTTEIQRERPMLQKEAMERLMQTKARSAMTHKVFKDVVDNIRQTQWFEKASAEGKEADVIDKLLREVKIAAIPQTTFLRISMTGQNKEDITNIVNAVAAAAVKDSAADSNSARQDTIFRLRDVKLEQRKLRDDSLNIIKSLHKRGIAGEAADSQHTLMATQQWLIRAMSEVRPAYAQALKSLETTQGQTDEELAEQPEVQQMLDYNYLLRMLEQQVTNLEIERDIVGKKFGDNHKSIKQLTHRLESAKAKLEEKRSEITAKSVAALKEMRQSAFLGIEAQFVDLRKEILQNDEHLKALETLLAELEQAKENKTQAEQNLIRLDMRLMDLRLLMRGEEPLVLHRQAQQPRQPSMPKYKIMVPIGVLLGLVFGLGISLLLEFMDTSIKAPADVSRRVDLPLLGMVPHLDDVEEDIEDLRVAFLTNPNTIICEAFRQIRTTLVFSRLAEQRRSILVTSAMPEDGRTSVSLNLGHCIANGGSRVLVVDANFRQPMIRKLFPMCPDLGLSSALVGQSDWRELVHEIEPNLFVMAAGPAPPNPAELLGSEQMRKQVSEFYDDYDQVIFDGSPCLVVSDAAVLSTMVDGVILTVRAGVNTYGIVQRTRDMLGRLGTHIFGIILNGVRVTAGGYLRKNYETFYEYRETPQLSASPTDQPAEEALNE